VVDLTVNFGGARAVDAFSCSVSAGEIVALLGANGAGKSTVLNAISGLVPAASGSIVADGTVLTELRPEQRAEHVAHVPEGRRLFPEHSVEENLDLAAFGRHRAVRRDLRERVHHLFPRLRLLADRPAGLLSGGEQQMVALGRGLMSGAPVLAIDELSLGLAPIVAAQFTDTLRQLRDEGLAILLVEQYVSLALSVADRLIVLERGRAVLAGTVSELGDEARSLQSAYLGAHETA